MNKKTDSTDVNCQFFVIMTSQDQRIADLDDRLQFPKIPVGTSGDVL